MYQNGYKQKVVNFISYSGANDIGNGITNLFQKELTNALNYFKHIIDNNKERFINLYPDAPIL
jgi:thermostable 8-oxoguanine DNA glycosylase